MRYPAGMTVQSIERAFTILRALSVGPLGVTELAERVDLPKSTVARLLSALDDQGAVTQDDTGGEYRLGEGLLEIAGATQPGRNLVATARPHLIELVEATGETAGISVLDGRSVYYLEHVEAEGDVQVRDWTGENAPLHAVPSGLVMLAHFSQRRLDKYLSGELAAITPWTIVDPDAIRERLVAIRSLGYAWVHEEFAEGINSVAAPVFDANGKVDTAIHVHGPAYRFPNPDRAHDVGTQVAQAAANIPLPHPVL